MLASFDLTQLAGRTVLVTGGAGLIGSRIAGLLRALGARPLSLCTLDAYPIPVYRDLFGVDPNSPDVVTGDVQDAELVRHLVRRSDYVIHAAALADVAACTREPMAALRTNITGTQVLLAAAAASDRIRRFVLTSSASVYGNGTPDDWSSPCPELRTVRELLETVYGRTPPRFHEQAPLRPLSVYANTKAWAETQTDLVLRPAGVSYAVVRFFSIYGEPQVVKPGSHSWVVAHFTAQAARGLPLHLNGGGHQVRDLIHVDDAAAATVRALVAPRAHQETVNVGTGIPISVRKVAELVREHYPATTFLETPMPPGDPLGGYASTHRMTNILEWRPSVPLADGVRRYARWLDQHPQAVPEQWQSPDERPVGA